MIDENCKLLYCLDYDSTFENIKEETPEFLAEYICKINNTYNKLVDRIINLQQENKKLQDNWDKLKEDLINDINYWEEQEKEWIKLGFIKFGGEANNKIIFKKVLNKMQELEGSEN